MTNGATVSIELDDMIERSEEFTVILVNDSAMKKFETQLSLLKLPIVSLKWLESCLLEEKYISPGNFDLRETEQIAQKGKYFIFLLEATLNVNHEEAKIILETKDCAEKMMNYLKNSVFYVKNLSNDNFAYVRDLIAVGGGIMLSGKIDHSIKNFIFFIF